jgi:hypothetical protein
MNRVVKGIAQRGGLKKQPAKQKKKKTTKEDEETKEKARPGEKASVESHKANAAEGAAELGAKEVLTGAEPRDYTPLVPNDAEDASDPRNVLPTEQYMLYDVTQAGDPEHELPPGTEWPEPFKPVEPPAEEERDDAQVKEEAKSKLEKKKEEAQTALALPVIPRLKAGYVKPFDPKLIPVSTGKCFTAAMFGKRHTGKSFTARWLMYAMRDQFPRIYVFTRTNINGFFAEFIPQRFIFDDYYPGVLWEIIEQQKQITQLSAATQGKIDPRCLIVMDDVADKDTRFDKAIQEVFTKGRHWNINLIITAQVSSTLQTAPSILTVLQYLKDLPPSVRTNTDFMFTFVQYHEKSRECIAEDFIKYVFHSAAAASLVDAFATATCPRRRSLRCSISSAVRRAPRRTRRSTSRACFCVSIRATTLAAPWTGCTTDVRARRPRASSWAPWSTGAKNSKTECANTWKNAARESSVLPRGSSIKSDEHSSQDRPCSCAHEHGGECAHSIRPIHDAQKVQVQA